MGSQCGLSEKSRGGDHSNCKREQRWGPTCPLHYPHSSTSSSFCTLYARSSYFCLWFLFILVFSCCLFSMFFYFYTVLSAAFAAFEPPEDLIKSAVSLKNQVRTWPWLFGSDTPPDLICYGQDCGLLWEQVHLPTHKESLRRGMWICWPQSTDS